MVNMYPAAFSLFLDGFHIRTQAPLELIASYFLRFASVVPLYREILNKVERAYITKVNVLYWNQENCEILSR